MNFPVLKQRLGYRIDIMKRGYCILWCDQCKESTMHRPIKVRKRFKDTNVTMRMENRFKCIYCGTVRKP